jgi:hypothetical protein
MIMQTLLPDSKKKKKNLERAFWGTQPKQQA